MNVLMYSIKLFDLTMIIEMFKPNHSKQQHVMKHLPGGVYSLLGSLALLCISGILPLSMFSEFTSDLQCSLKNVHVIFNITVFLMNRQI
jgi:hypothetical protein